MTRFARAASFVVAVVVAIAVEGFAPAWLYGIARAVAAYDIAAFVLLAALWTFVIEADAGKTRYRAAQEDPGRNAILVCVMVAAAAALLASIAILGRGPSVQSAHEKALVDGLAMGAVVLGWFLIHTLFIFRYAHLYYFDDDDDNEADRGLKFPGTDEPNDMDFAYFSFVIGMSYQVSDVQITDRRVRRVALYHALVSFAYSTMILALTINIVSGLLH